jgi:hypothetical protein
MKRFKHAIVEREGFKVPLIGVPASSVEEECDCCHDIFQLRQLEIQQNGQLLCAKCRAPTPVQK